MKNKKFFRFSLTVPYADSRGGGLYEGHNRLSVLLLGRLVTWATMTATYYDLLLFGRLKVKMMAAVFHVICNVASYVRIEQLLIFIASD